MKASRAVTAAVKLFEKEKVGDFRTLAFWEMSGADNNFDYVLINIKYAIDGDYTESDAHPFLVGVSEVDGKPVARRVQ